jgi:hypothetical protein
MQTSTFHTFQLCVVVLLRFLRLLRRCANLGFHHCRPDENGAYTFVTACMLVPERPYAKRGMPLSASAQHDCRCAALCALTPAYFANAQAVAQVEPATDSARSLSQRILLRGMQLSVATGVRIRRARHVREPSVCLRATIVNDRPDQACRAAAYSACLRGGGTAGQCQAAIAIIAPPPLTAVHRKRQ